MTQQHIDDTAVIIHLLKMIDEDETIDIKKKHPLIDAVVYLADLATYIFSKKIMYKYNGNVMTPNEI